MRYFITPCLVLVAALHLPATLACSSPYSLPPDEDSNDVEAQGEKRGEYAASPALERSGHRPDEGMNRARHAYIHDGPGDRSPDLPTEFVGPEPLDTMVTPPLSELTSGGFQFPNCKPNFQHAGPRLCITNATQSKAKYGDAVNACRKLFANVCTFEDMTYLYFNANQGVIDNHKVKDKWLGNVVSGVGDVLCGKKNVSNSLDPNIYDFEGHCDKNQIPPLELEYWCCHDDKE